MSSNTPIGIDIGTSYSCVAVWQNGAVVVVEDDEGNRITPSCIAFSDNERIIGSEAKSLMGTNPKNTIHDVIRLIGRHFHEPSLQNDIQQLGYKVVKGKNDSLLIEVTFKGELKFFSPEEIVAMILRNLKRNAEIYLDAAVTDAVITVPGYFNSNQRQSIRDAAQIAGLHVLRILSQSLAAALTFSSFEYKRDGVKNILLFDLGGGTLDIAVATLDSGIVEVKAVVADSNLGGVDFDQRVVDYFTEEIKALHNYDIVSDVMGLSRLHSSCERAKRHLSEFTEITVEIEALVAGETFRSELTRVRFEELNNDYFAKCIAYVQQVLLEAHLAKGEIDEVVLVGGSTNIPKIQQLLSEYFDNKVMNNALNCEECIASGAALYAVVLAGKDYESSQLIRETLLLDVTPQSFGIEAEDGVFCPLIKHNTTTPASRSHVFAAHVGHHHSVHVKVYEGEHGVAHDNHLIGTYHFQGLPSDLPEGRAQIRATFDVDADGILTVTATELSGAGHKLHITCDRERMTSDDIDKATARLLRIEAAERDQPASKKHRE